MENHIFIKKHKILSRNINMDENNITYLIQFPIIKMSGVTSYPNVFCEINLRYFRIILGVGNDRQRSDCNLTVTWSLKRQTPLNYSAK